MIKTFSSQDNLGFYFVNEERRTKVVNDDPNKLSLCATYQQRKSLKLDDSIRL
ncbi:MAG TPA: hypothetical protein VFY41_02865 [Nitrososphaeraceae archaeon]|nr:hypothetical protein [Nitrososphaeraceae archaeon]